MDRYKKHIFVCVNERPADHPKGCCSAKESMALFQALRAKISELGLKESIKATKSGCLAACETGPTLVVYPEGIWYKNVTMQDIDEIIEKHISQNNPVQRLRNFTA